MDNLERRRRQLDRELERARGKLQSMKREDYKSQSAYRRVHTQLRGHVSQLERLLAAIGEPGIGAGGKKGGRERRCPRCWRPKDRLYYLEGGPVALCYQCWAELGKEWWERRDGQVDASLTGMEALEASARGVGLPSNGHG